jgi:secreted trypsin-like serine protease
MNKKLVAFLSILSLSLSVLLIPANAIENGESALNHPRIVSMYFTIDSRPNEIWPSCSAWLYSPRIVFTAAHCLYDGSVRPKKVLRTPSNTYVGLPGALKTFKRSEIFAKASNIFVYDTFDFYYATAGGSLSYKDDFAAVVLEKPLANVEVAKLASKEFLSELIAKNEFIETGGYGYHNNSRQVLEGDEPKKAKFQLIPFETGMRTVNEFKQKWFRNYFQEDAAFVKISKNGAAPCDGDSGSSYFYNENGKYTHMGVTMGMIGTPNCGIDPWTENPVGVFRPIYFDMEIVKLAEKYVADNPYVEPKSKTAGFNNKITITCVKGKTTKKVSGITPKCPVGYKKK